MSGKRNMGSVGGNAKTVSNVPLPVGASDMFCLSTSDRLDFAFKKRMEKIDWRRIGNQKAF